MKIRTVIADDERPARRRVEMLLGDFPEVEIVAQCENGLEVVEECRRHSPDLLFLDIQMPELDGLEALRALGPEGPRAVIFVTAFDHYALRAFDAQAVDYLLKPYDSGRFRNAFERARELLSVRKTTAMLGGQLLDLLENMKARPAYLERLVLRSAGRIAFRGVSELDWAEAEGNYVRLHFGKESHLQREKLSVLAEKLDPRRFARPHRSVLVNIDRVRELRQVFHGNYVVILQNGIEVTLGRPYREPFLEQVARRTEG